ncbi:MAG TPA: hypothetical protein VEW93_08930 [Acidimicrobiales bacterium]|nr:hypothetical protein [Acidimicrobiales bacterium]
MLVPAGALVFIVLGAVAVDLSHVHLRQREVIAAVQGAASDAAASSYRDDAFYAGGDVVIDRGDASREARASLAATGLDITVTSLTVTPAGEVVIEAEAPVETIFATALPGGPDTVTVTATARARLAG